MLTPREPRTCSLHVVVPEDADDRPLTAFAGTLHDQLDAVSLLIPAPDGAGIEPYRRAMALADALEAACGRRPRCVEAVDGLHGALAAALATGTGRHIVVIGADAPRRTIRAVRRAARWAGAHVAVLPPAGGVR